MKILPENGIKNLYNLLKKMNNHGCNYNRKNKRIFIYLYIKKIKNVLYIRNLFF